MKRTLKIILLFLCISVITAALASCGKELNGTYYNEDKTMVFEGDTFKYSLVSDSPYDSYYVEGTYKISMSKITFTIEKRVDGNGNSFMSLLKSGFPMVDSSGDTSVITPGSSSGTGSGNQYIVTFKTTEINGREAISLGNQTYILGQ